MDLIGFLTSSEFLTQIASAVAALLSAFVGSLLSDLFSSN